MLRLCLLLACVARPADAVGSLRTHLADESKASLQSQMSEKESAAQEATLQNWISSNEAAYTKEASKIVDEEDNMSADAAVADAAASVGDVEVEFKMPANLDDSLPKSKDLSLALSLAQQAPSKAGGPVNAVQPAQESPPIFYVKPPSVEDAWKATLPRTLPRPTQALADFDTISKENVKPLSPPPVFKIESPLENTVKLALKKQESQVEAETAQQVEAQAPKKKGPKEIEIRPNAGSKIPEIITYGMFAKNFYGVNLKRNDFMIDIVMTLKWTDKRVIKLIPEGSDALTLSKKDSTKLIWLPGMVVTNRDLKKHDVISTAVMINRKGEVFKVERSTVGVKNNYVLNDYPYDNQKLVVKIASSIYMIDEVVLKPSSKGSGVADNLMKGYNYHYVDYEAHAVKDIDGLLKKSRGLLTINVKRDPDQYFQNHLIPCFLLSCISCGIFWFPFAAPFITPRVALSILALIGFTNLTMASDNSLPGGAPYNWNDLLNGTVLSLMFANVAMNVFTEMCFHQLKVNDVAMTINWECKMVAPFVFAMSVSTIFSTAGPHGWMSLDTASIVVKMMMVVIWGGYLIYCTSRIVEALAKKRTLDVSDFVKPKA